MSKTINEITNETGATLTVIQGGATYEVGQGGSMPLNPTWEIFEGGEERLSLQVYTDEDSNGLYLWYVYTDDSVNLYESTTASGVGQEGGTIPRDVFGLVFYEEKVNSGNTIIVGTVDTMVDPDELTLASVVDGLQQA